MGNVTSTISKFNEEILNTNESECKATNKCENKIEVEDFSPDCSACKNAQDACGLLQTCTADTTCTMKNIVDIASKLVNEKNIKSVTDALPLAFNISTSVSDVQKTIKNHLINKCSPQNAVENLAKIGKFKVICGGDNCGTCGSLIQTGNAQTQCAMQMVSKAIIDVTDKTIVDVAAKGLLGGFKWLFIAIGIAVGVSIIAGIIYAVIKARKQQGDELTTAGIDFLGNI